MSRRLQEEFSETLLEVLGGLFALGVLGLVATVFMGAFKVFAWVWGG